MKYTKGPWSHIEYAGFFQIQKEPFYNIDDDLLDREKCHEAENNALLCSLAPEMYETLKEISEGKGKYNEDKLIHCSNTVEDMKQLAINLLKKFNK